MWNHGAAMEQKIREATLAWPTLKADEMAHIVGFLEALGRSRR
jgi:hypothetical protein